jgi:glycosyltransferase involved in cell wall biosynthesis
MKKIALLPVYNEQATLVPVLNAIFPHVDCLIVVDDGSTDSSLKMAVQWSGRHRQAIVLQLAQNRGMSVALREGFEFVKARLAAGEFRAEDVLITIDADGQHDARAIPALCEHVESHALDVALTRRDFSLYPPHKRLGNTLMTLWGSLWSGYRYHDIESGFRAMRVKVVPILLDYYTGRGYSCAQEIAILTSRLGFRVDNRFLTTIRHYRSQTALKDVLVNASLGFWAFSRWALGRKVAARGQAARAACSGDFL